MFSPHFSLIAKVFSRESALFLIVKVFVAKSEENNVIHESLCPQFRDFFFSRNFLPAKVYGLKVYFIGKSHYIILSLEKQMINRKGMKEGVYKATVSMGIANFKFLSSFTIAPKFLKC